MMSVMNDQGPYDTSAPDLLLAPHRKFVQELDKDTLEYWLTEHLRVDGVNWSLNTLRLLGHPGALDKEKIVEFLVQCQHHNGGVGGHIHHDPHLVPTLSAIQVLFTYDCLDAINVDKVVDHIVSLQNHNGLFSGDSSRQTDTRFTMRAVSCLSLLKRLDDARLSLEKTIEYIVRCRNFDGGLDPVLEAKVMQSMLMFV
ncbi:hypothetical protein BG006_011509 [Podila minutissima]|uniref:Geranylgeranyl transferase type II subunit beta n=1 Tax=Podila minutissima TaxID=64525 RepID=A0A9P5SBS1_9FUNG|nr:hypothetical protein BG006_011509 [Podila minutissima]